MPGRARNKDFTTRRQVRKTRHNPPTLVRELALVGRAHSSIICLQYSGAVISPLPPSLPPLPSFSLYLCVTASASSLPPPRPSLSPAPSDSSCLHIPVEFPTNSAPQIRVHAATDGPDNPPRRTRRHLRARRAL